MKQEGNIGIMVHIYSWGGNKNNLVKLILFEGLPEMSFQLPKPTIPVNGLQNHNLVPNAKLNVKNMFL